MNPGKVLVVDDDRDILDAIKKTLLENLHSIEVITASDGSEAVRLFEKHLPAVVVLDLMLPRRSGLLVFGDIRRKTRAGPKPEAPPIVIMITSNQGARHRSYCLNSGVWRYFLKPFRVEDLMEAVQEAVAKAKSFEKKRR